MDTFLILLGALGFGAIIIAIHVFLLGADAHASHATGTRELTRDLLADAGLCSRQEGDRRSGQVVTAFPLWVNDTLVQQDRRALVERRRTALG